MNGFQTKKSPLPGRSPFSGESCLVLGVFFVLLIATHLQQIKRCQVCGGLIWYSYPIGSIGLVHLPTLTIENIPSPMDPIGIDTARYVSKFLNLGTCFHRLKSAVIKFYPAFVRGKRQKTLRSYVRRMFSQYLGFTCSVCFRKSHVRHCSVSQGINGQKISPWYFFKKNRCSQVLSLFHDRAFL